MTESSPPYLNWESESADLAAIALQVQLLTGELGLQRAALTQAAALLRSAADALMLPGLGMSSEADP